MFYRQSNTIFRNDCFACTCMCSYKNTLFLLQVQHWPFLKLIKFKLIFSCKFLFWQNIIKVSQIWFILYGILIFWWISLFGLSLNLCVLKTVYRYIFLFVLRYVILFLLLLLTLCYFLFILLYIFFYFLSRHCLYICLFLLLYILSLWLVLVFFLLSLFATFNIKQLFLIFNSFL